MTGSGAADTLLLIAAILAAVVTIAGSARKIWQFLDSWEDALGVLKGIAEQFRPNAGESLHDRITALEAHTHQIQKDLESVLINRPRPPPTVRAEVDDPEPDGSP